MAPTADTARLSLQKYVDRYEQDKRQYAVAMQKLQTGAQASSAQSWREMVCEAQSRWQLDFDCSRR